MTGDHQTMTQLQFRLDNLGCASCATRMEDAIGRLPGVGQVSLDFASARLQVDVRDPVLADSLPEQIRQIVSQIEQDVCLLPADTAIWQPDQQTGSQATTLPIPGKNRAWHQSLQVPWRRVLRLVLGAVVFMLPWLLRLAEPAGRTVWLLAWLILGGDVVWIAVRKLFRRQWFDEHFLMSIATIGALAIGEYPEAVAVMLFYQTGELLQRMAVDHSRRSIRALLAIRPDQALRITNSGTESVHPRDVSTGDRLMIRPGDRVPLDSAVLEGVSEMDTAALTGESQPRYISPGDEIKAGFVNGGGMLVVEVLRPEAASAVSRILSLVEDASSRKAPAERLITRFARIYTPIMIGLAFLLAIGPPLLLQQPFELWLYRALILIVISCPCALVLSVPLSYFAAIGRASALGILVKGGQYLDRLSVVDTMAWDKTGTLTDGTYQVRRIVARYPGAEQDVLALAALLEHGSTHPLARSVVAAWQEQSPASLELRRLRRVVYRPGRGLEAEVDAQTVLLGNSRLLADHGVSIELSLPSSDWQDNDGTVLYLAVDSTCIGLIELAANLRPGARETISRLRSLGVHRHHLLSGDQTAAAAAVAQAVGMDQSLGDLMPEQKVAALDALLADRTSTGSVAYVGDGINDAPVLARADVSIAMGSGSDAALESADIVILGDDLQRLPDAVRLARLAGRIVRQNIALALVLKLLIMGLAVFGLGGIWQAIFADVGVSLIAVINALRITR